MKHFSLMAERTELCNVINTNYFGNMFDNYQCNSDCYVGFLEQISVPVYQIYSCIHYTLQKKWLFSFLNVYEYTYQNLLYLVDFAVDLSRLKRYFLLLYGGTLFLPF